MHILKIKTPKKPHGLLIHILFLYQQPLVASWFTLNLTAISLGHLPKKNLSFCYPKLSIMSALSPSHILQLLSHSRFLTYVLPNRLVTTLNSSS